MTVYVTDGDGCDLFLWADGDTEAILAAAAVGHACDCPFRQWHAYRLTWDQWALAVADGATVTDRWEPAYQLACRDPDKNGLIQVILTHRLRAA